MSNVQSRIVNVIETTFLDEKTYFTLEGVMIGGFKGGARTEPKEVKPQVIKPHGGIIKSPTPEQVRRSQDKEAEALQTTEGRIQHLKNDVA